MDENLRDVLIAALPVIGGILVAILVTKITADRSLDLERAKWKRELYATFLHASDGVRDGVHQAVDGFQNDGWTSNISVAQKALDEISMLSPKMAVHASRVWRVAGDLMTGVLHFEDSTIHAEGTAVPIDRTNYAALDAVFLLARRAFIDAAAKELS